MVAKGEGRGNGNKKKKERVKASKLPFNKYNLSAYYLVKKDPRKKEAGCLL